eukprot:990916-Rhodomonas_salina.3
MMLGRRHRVAGSSEIQYSAESWRWGVGSAIAWKAGRAGYLVVLLGYLGNRQGLELLFVGFQEPGEQAAAARLSGQERRQQEQRRHDGLTE